MHQIGLEIKMQRWSRALSFLLPTWLGHVPEGERVDSPWDGELYSQIVALFVNTSNLKLAGVSRRIIYKLLAPCGILSNVTGILTPLLLDLNSNQSELPSE